MDLGNDGADVIAIRGNGDNAWQRDAVNTQNANPGSVIALSAYSDDVGMSSMIPGLENVTSSFGKVNSITMRDHSTANYYGGVAGVFTNNLLLTFNNKVSGGSIKMDACAGVSFFGCYNANDARSFTLSTGITSYGSTAKVGMESFRNGTYNSGVHSQTTLGSFMKYSRYSNYVNTSGYSISSQNIGRVIGGINYK